MMNKLNVVFLGCTQGYGYSFSACNTKVEFMVRGLHCLDDRCVIHNGENGLANIKSKSIISTEFANRVISYPRRFSILSPLFNLPSLYQDLKIEYREGVKNIVIVEAPYLPNYIAETKIAHLLGYKVVVIAHEWLETYQLNTKIRTWLSHEYSKVFGDYVDGILPISEYIIRKIDKFKKPYLKTPIEADFSKAPSSKKRKPFFLYCVSGEYYRVIKLIIDSYNEYKREGGVFSLIMVISGTELQLRAVEDYVQLKYLAKDITIKSRIPYSELEYLYSHASGLLVPLNPAYEQDKARFSQKIAEYLSSGSPIITNNVGEIKTYFSNQENAIITDYSLIGFSKAFKWIENNPIESMQIGYQGYCLGKDNFDFRKCGNELHNFLLDL